jgi:peptidoglycan-associated lipoprotein
MFYLLRHYSGLLLALVLVGSLAACSTTSTSSGASRATKTVTPTPQQQADSTAETPDGEAESAAGTSAMQAPAEAGESMEQPGAVEDGVTTGAVQGADAVAGVEEFPVQRYEIDDTSGTESDTEAEIDRLRRELAATESELDRMRAEEEQQDYSTGQAGVSDDESQLDRSPAEEAQQQYSADEVDAAADKSAGRASGTSPAETTVAQGAKSRANIADLPGKPVEFSIYFGYDEAAFESRFEPVIVAHADFLKANPELNVEIQGNCDERGSREYNIALGQRRAFAVKRALELLGVAGHRIDAVSFGSEKPIAFGRDEESWRLNRRADIVY